MKKKRKARQVSKRPAPASRRPRGLPPLVLNPQAAGLLPGKMSEALLHVARPLIEELPDPDDPEQMRALLQLAALAWNLSRLESAEEQQEALREAVDSAPHATAEERADLHAVLSEMLARAVKLWPGSRATVAGVVVEDAGDTLSIRALTALSG